MRSEDHPTLLAPISFLDACCTNVVFRSVQDASAVLLSSSRLAPRRSASGGYLGDTGSTFLRGEQSADAGKYEKKRILRP